jgi:hypothetical protein
MPLFQRQIVKDEKMLTSDEHVSTGLMEGGGGGRAVAQLFETRRNKPEGRGVDSRGCHWNFSLT